MITTVSGRTCLRRCRGMTGTTDLFGAALQEYQHDFPAKHTPDCYLLTQGFTPLEPWAVLDRRRPTSPGPGPKNPEKAREKNPVRTTVRTASDVRGRTSAHSASPASVPRTLQLPSSDEKQFFVRNHANDRIYVHKEWFVTALPEASSVWQYGWGWTE
jgi:hypothetical protein